MNEAPDEQNGRAEIVRAEKVVDSMGQGIAALASRMGHQLLKGAALAREEAEDIWAEAQSMARGPQQQ